MAPTLGEWVKMRVSIDTHPKLIAIAEFLASDRSFMNFITDPVHVTCSESLYEYVTPCVTRYVCVTGLLRVWGRANEVGKRHGDDLVLRPASLSTLDDMAGLPTFGEAMKYVGWAVEEEIDSGCSSQIRFPNFMLHNVPAEERKPSPSAIRMRRLRARRRENLTDSPLPDPPQKVTSQVTSQVTSDVAPHSRHSGAIVAPLLRPDKKRIEEKKEEGSGLRPAPSRENKFREEGQPESGEEENAPDPQRTRHPQKRPRRRDELWDTVVEVSGADAVVNRTHIGKVCSALRGAEPPYTPSEVRALPGILAARGFTLPLSLGTVQAYIGWTRYQPAAAAPAPQGNGASHSALFPNLPLRIEEAMKRCRKR